MKKTGANSSEQVQLSILDIIDDSYIAKSGISSKDIESIISKLNYAKKKAAKREEKGASPERKRRAGTARTRRTGAERSTYTGSNQYESSDGLGECFQC